MSSRKKISVVVTSSEAGQAMNAVAERLAEQGLVIKSKMQRLGVMVGLIEPDKVAALSEVEGVANVRPEGEVRIAGS